MSWMLGRDLSRSDRATGLLCGWLLVMAVMILLESHTYDWVSEHSCLKIPGAVHDRSLYLWSVFLGCRGSLMPVMRTRALPFW